MNQLILPIKKPSIRCLLYDALPLSIVEHYGNSHMEWIYSNYVQLSTLKYFIKEGHLFLEFIGEHGINCPFLKIQTVYLSSLKYLKLDMHLYFINLIEQGYYVYLYVDEYYIPNTRSYKKKHFVHDLMINGFNRKLGIYSVVGYFNDEFSEAKVSLSDLYNGLFHNKSNTDLSPWQDKIFLMKYNHKASYHFNSKLLSLLLEDFLLSQNTFEEYDRFQNRNVPRCFGLNIYDSIIDYIDYFNTNQKNPRFSFFDIRIFRTLLEHKQIMNSRLHYINSIYKNITDILSLNNELFDMSNRCMIISLRYSTKKKDDILTGIKKEILNMKEKDEVLFNSFHKSLSTV